MPERLPSGLTPGLLVATCCAGFSITSCASTPAQAPRENEHPTARASDAPPLGHVDRATIAALAKWQEAARRPQVDEQAARALRSVPAGAMLRIFFGTWCGDSRREVSRFWKALDTAGGAVPFALEYVAVGRDMQAPGGLAAGADLHYVPTFIVSRDGQEVGRIVESPESSIEQDLGSLLRGDRRGVISGRADLPGRN